MVKFKLLKRFVDNELIDNPYKGDPGQPEKICKTYNPGDTMEFDVDSKGKGPDAMKIGRMLVYGIIALPKKRGRKRKIERAVTV